MYRTSAIQAPDSAAGVVVVHCADPRYQPHFQNFLRHQLGIPHYALLAVPGGAHCLTLAEAPLESGGGDWSWMKFLVNLTRPRRVILIGHDDCRWYLDSCSDANAANLREKVIADLRRVRSTIGERFPGPRVELYFAKQNPDGTAIFETA